jgi:hypothetical protein
LGDYEIDRKVDSPIRTLLMVVTASSTTLFILRLSRWLYNLECGNVDIAEYDIFITVLGSGKSVLMLGCYLKEGATSVVSFTGDKFTSSVYTLNKLHSLCSMRIIFSE